eukprot:scaffold73587_cov63-Phaeocystis_antarctica.AAC.2
MVRPGQRTPYVQCVASGRKLPCASGTYSTQEAGTRSPHVQYGGPGTYVSAQSSTCAASCHGQHRAARASQSCQVCPEEAREPSSGTAMGGTLTMLRHVRGLVTELLGAVADADVAAATTAEAQRASRRQLEDLRHPCVHTRS